MSPLENAIESIEVANARLRGLVEQHRAEPAARVDPLGMVLNGVVDAAVNGGIANFRVSLSAKTCRVCFSFSNPEGMWVSVEFTRK